MADEREVIDWFTNNGSHIPIFKGETKNDAFQRWSHTDRETSKQTDIERRKAQADVLNEIEYRKQHQDDNTGSSFKQTADSKEFKDALDKAKDSRTDWDKWRVDNEHDAQWYKDHNATMIMSKGGSTLAVMPDGDIISVCKMRGDKTTTGSQMMRMAVSRGGTKLDSFSGNHSFYAENGFVPVSWTQFDEKYAPKGWKESGMGAEPVIFYKYVGVDKVPAEYKGDDGCMKFLNDTKASKDYDAAKVARDKSIKKK